ncbi:ABC transporter type 1/ ATPase component [Synechococcus sp. RS9915]|nr:ABC transporter type 1/ ATPase component [Synechococcus sp. RS9915]
MNNINLPLYTKLYKIVPRKYKLYLLRVGFLVFASALSELLLFASLALFLQLITTNPDTASGTLGENFKFLDLQYLGNILDLRILASIFLVCTIFLTNILRISSLRKGSLFAARVGSFISNKSYENILSRNYLNQFDSNSSQSINNIIVMADNTSQALNMAILLIVSVLLTIVYTLALFVYNWKISLFSLSVLIASYYLVSSLTKRTLIKNSSVSKDLISNQIQLIQESLRNIKDIILDNKLDYYVLRQKDIDSRIRILQAENYVLTAVPRYLLECITFSTIITIALFGIISKDSFSIVADIGILVMTLQRLLPIMNQIYVSISQMRAYSAPVNAIIEIATERSNNSYQYLFLDALSKMQSNIRLENVNFSFNSENTSDKNCLNNVNFKIEKGAKVGIVGLTGSGKSTLMNLLMGLYRPISGKILLDGVLIDDKGVNIRKRSVNSIAHVPQSVVLVEASIAENIAIGISYESINWELLHRVADIACVEEFVRNLPSKYATIVGEDGNKLSGGQKQRIGIARALYRQPSCLFLDEATSALDTDTEYKLISNLTKRLENLTIISITHRKSTLKNFDMILTMANGTVQVNTING